MSAGRRAYYANMSPEQRQAFCAQRRAQAAARVAKKRAEKETQQPHTVQAATQT
jgi:hypothetical protein